MRNERFEFDSNGETLIGTLYLPAGRAAAAVVTTGPLTSVKEQAAGTYAKAMAARGFAALAFDHRYFGESGGQPRQFENPAAKVEDVRNAVRHLRAMNERGAWQSVPLGCAQAEAIWPAPSRKTPHSSVRRGGRCVLRCCTNQTMDGTGFSGGNRASGGGRRAMAKDG